MLQFHSSIVSCQYRATPLRVVRFGNQSASDKMEPEEMNAAADVFRHAVKTAESMAGADGHDSPLYRLLSHLLNGDAAMGAKLAEALKQVAEGDKSQRSCTEEVYRKGTSDRVRYRVKSGNLEKVFEKRQICSGDNLSFDAFLEQRFGKNNRVIIAMTGWTKPPVEPLLNDPYYGPRMKKLSESKWPEYAEQVYVNLIKKFMDDVMTNLKQELPDFNPTTDLGFIYGVTPEGVDRGVEEYCLQKSIPIVGLTAYDWAEYIPDENGLPPVYLAEDPAEFGSLMADCSNKLIITGGRGFAAGQKLDGSAAKGADRRLPVDLFDSYASIHIPPVVPGSDELSAKVVNAAALAKLMGCNPWENELVQAAINGRKTDNRDVFAATHVLKRELEKLYQSRELGLSNT